MHKKDNAQPTLLAFDTSTDKFIAAVSRGGKVKTMTSSASFRHSHKMFSNLAKFLKKSRLGFEDLDAIGVGLGPGSFTGLRVGVTTAKIMFYALSIPMMGVSSLQIIAQAFLVKNSAIGIVQDAGRHNVYQAIYCRDRTLKKPGLIAFDKFIEQADSRICYTGSAYIRYQKEIKCHLRNRFIKVHQTQWKPNAKALMVLTRLAWLKKEFMICAAAAPEYLYERDCNITSPKSRR